MDDMMRTFSHPGVFAFLLGSLLTLNPARAEDEKPVRSYQDQIRSELPVAHWSFEKDQPLLGTPRGRVTFDEVGPDKKDSKLFLKPNRAAKFAFAKSGSYIQLQDVGPGSQFDFDNGDPITMEAWVKPEGTGGALVILCKGRTGNSGFDGSNQNYAFRLVGSGKTYSLGFLFRSRREANKPSGWHRWTSTASFAPDGKWHHVALTYVFGKPESILGFIDGDDTKGTWDMDGATTRPPVVDDDDIWVGSAQKGAESASYQGLLDEVALYRKVFTGEQIAMRYSVEPYFPKIDLTTLKQDQVKVEIVENLSKGKKWPRFFSKPSLVFYDDAFALAQMPVKYNEKGVRDDWRTPVLIRSSARIALKPGDNRILLRTRGAGRLWMDGKKIAETDFGYAGGGAHNNVSAIPQEVTKHLRRLAMGDREQMVTVKGDGKPHLFVLEMIAGSGNRRATLGETSVSMANGDDMFFLMSPQRQVELVDESWLPFWRERQDFIRGINASNRRLASAKDRDYWDRRHAMAREVIAKKKAIRPGGDVGNYPVNNEIDRFLAADWVRAAQRAEKKAKTGALDYVHDVKPILADQCFRCHGKKIKGGLRLDDRAAAMKGGDSESPAIVPGKPNESYLLEMIDPQLAEDDVMPPKGDPLSKEQREILKRWIVEGADYSAGSLDIQLTELTGDLEFLRRVSLDTVGVIPSEEEITAFLKVPQAERRSKVIDKLLADNRWADHWVSYWQDVLAENPNILKGKLNNTGPFRFWIHDALEDNLPMDRFVTELVMMEGSKLEGGPAGFGIATQNDSPPAAKTHVLGTAFLGINMKCARCHDAPYHNTKQKQLFQMAAMLNRGTLTLPKTSTVPASTFAGRKPLVVSTLKPGDKIDPAWTFRNVIQEQAIEEGVIRDPGDSRERLAALITSPHNDRFAGVITNRIWKCLMGAGFVDTVGDWETSSPVYPELLNWLADQFVESGYDLKFLTRLILNSHAYQRKARPLQSGELANFTAPLRRRMEAEQIVDSLLVASGKKMDSEELTFDADGTQQTGVMISLGYPRRAWEFASLSNERDRPSLALPRAQAVVDVLKNFGWTGARQGPLSDRDEQPNVRQPAILLNGTFGKRVVTMSEDSAFTDLATRKGETVEGIVDSVFLRVLTRPPSADERELYVQLLKNRFDQRIIPENERTRHPAQKPLGQVSWSNHLSPEANTIMMEIQKRVKEGDPPTTKLLQEWRERMEDMLWATMNSPEFIYIP